MTDVNEKESVEDVAADYTYSLDVVGAKELYVVVKSLDQIERRQRLIESKERGTIGRISSRPIAEGLLVRIELDGNRTVNADNASLVQSFREPRGMVPVDDNRYLLTTIGRVLLIDAEGQPLREYTHPYFAFLHSVEFDPERDTFLVVSSGYDAIFEVDLETGTPTWEWFGWEHGFNSTDEGVYLTRSRDRKNELEDQGLNVEYVDPDEYNEQGLLTSNRTTHPAAACYNPHTEGDTILAVLGREGEVIEIDRETGDHEPRITDLASMPHAIQPHDGGWMVTNTLEGEFWLLDRGFEKKQIIRFAGLEGKPEGMEEHEWLQAVFPLSKSRFIGIDANRGFIVLDLDTREYAVVPCDENWCVQHLATL